MTTYSHTRLGAFQECRYRYKLRYLDKVKVDVPDTVETFMGKLVHASLEKLYKDLQFQKLATKEELLASFDAAWDQAWDDRIRIVKPEYTAANYRAMGRKFIAEYYDHYAPFDGPRTVGLETNDVLPLSNGHAYSVRIDRLCCDANGVYYVCDYKTNSHLKAQEELDEDRQLAMYSLWVRSRYSDCRDVKLVWYFLAFDKELVSERNDAQLAALKASTEALIDEVEKCQAFPTNVSSLCDWCEYKALCPAWKHGEELKEKPPEVFADDEGVKLVDAYAALSSEKKLLDEDLEKVRARLIAFARHKQVEAVFGTKEKASVKGYETVSFPAKSQRDELVRLLRAHGLYDEFSDVDTHKLAAAFLADPRADVRELLERFGRRKEMWVVKVGKKG